jgi:hypothetical protein
MNIGCGHLDASIYRWDGRYRERFGGYDSMLFLNLTGPLFVSTF